MKRRNLTYAELEDAARLLELWTAYKARHKGATQAWLAEEAGIGSQGAVGQYLRGAIPLNIPALLAICRVISADPFQVSSRLTRDISVVLPTFGIGLGTQNREVRHPSAFGDLGVDYPNRKAEVPVNDVFPASWRKRHNVSTQKGLIVIAAPDDSMSKRIRAGDSLLVDTRNREIQDDAVLAFATGDGFRIKRVFVRFDGLITLRSDNPEFPEETASSPALDVIGRVIGVAGTLL